MGSSFKFDWHFFLYLAFSPLSLKPAGSNDLLYLLCLLVRHRSPYHLRSAERTFKVQICSYYFLKGDFQQLVGKKNSCNFQVRSFLGNKFKHPTGAEMTFEFRIAKLIGRLTIIRSRP